MADKKKKAAKKSAVKKAPKERVLGIATVGSTKGNILSELLDGKVHTLESLKECRVDPGDSVGWRLSMLKDSGKRAERPFKLELDDDKVKLVFLSGTSKPNGKANGKAKLEAKAAAKEKLPHPATVAKAAVHDVPVEED
jgi:hypothetical protein